MGSKRCGGTGVVVGGWGWWWLGVLGLIERMAGGCGVGQVGVGLLTPLSEVIGSGEGRAFDAKNDYGGT